MNTKSLALSVHDPDAPAGKINKLTFKGTWYHWIVKDMSITTKIIAEHSIPGIEITNSWGIKKYKGP